MAKRNLENGVMTNALHKTPAKFNCASPGAVQADPTWVSFFTEALRLHGLILSRRATFAASMANVKEIPLLEQTAGTV